MNGQPIGFFREYGDRPNRQRTVGEYKFHSQTRNIDPGKYNEAVQRSLFSYFLRLGRVCIYQSAQDDGWLGSVHATTWSNIQITRATSMAGLKTATPKVIWSDLTPSRCCNIWAPEIHWITSANAWFVYYTAGTAGVDQQGIHVLKSSSSDLWASTWSYAGRVAIPNKDVWSIDATILNHSTGSYLVYSAYDKTVFQSDQCMYIAKLTSPTTVGNASKLSCPTNSWEKIVTGVNEGPAALYHGGRTWIVYSASHCSGTGYALGRLELTGSDPLSTSSWTKYNAGPIFQAENGNYAVGHNGFLTAPSGNIYNVYHASPSSAVTCDGNRRTMVQPVNWNSDGTPNLGAPRPLSENIPEPA